MLSFLELLLDSLKFISGLIIIFSFILPKFLSLTTAERILVSLIKASFHILRFVYCFEFIPCLKILAKLICSFFLVGSK